MTRYGCLLIFFLALMNAPVYSAADVQNRKAYDNSTYGGGLAGYSGDFVPSFDEVQSGIFNNSLLGPPIKKNLGMLLINTDGSDKSHATVQKKAVIHLGD